MSKHRPVPSIGRGPQQFSQRVSPIQSPMMPSQSIVQSSAEWQDLAMEIYCRLAVDLMFRDSSVPDAELPEELDRAAKQSKLAAQVYFQGQQQS